MANLQVTRYLGTVLALLALGCDGGEGSSDASAADAAEPDADVADADVADADVADASEQDGASPARPLEVSITVAEVAPGEEDTVCIETRLGNDRAVFVPRMQTRILRGSHHMIVYRSNAESESPEPQPCNGFQGILGGTVPLAMAQRSEADHPLPDGTGFHIEANQMVRLELHYINTSAEPIDAVGEAELDIVDADGSDLKPVDFMFFGPTAFTIDERSTETASRYYPVPKPTDEHPEPLRVFAVTTHTHRLGTHATVHRASGPGDPDELLHESFDWAEPPIDRFDPSLTIEEGGLLVTCEWNNHTDNPVGFGESFYDEMCFGIAMYYPSRGFLLDL